MLGPPADHVPDGRVEGQPRREIRYVAADLGVVEDGTMRQVTEDQLGPEPVRRPGENVVRRDVHDPRLDPEGSADDRVDLIPGVDVIGGNVEHLADGTG